MLKLFRNLFPSADQRIFLAAGKEAFENVCASDTSAAEIYKEHPSVRIADWRRIRHALLELTNVEEQAKLNLRIRGAFASAVEALVRAHYYTNLDVADRDHFAAFVESTRETCDRDYYFAMAHDYAYAAVLEFVIFAAWTGSKEELKERQRLYIDICKSHCAMFLRLAKAKAEGRPITEAETASAKTENLLKELARRALAGEKVLDDT